MTDPSPPVDPMNLTAAELRREYCKALAMVAQQANELADLRAQLAARDREIATLRLKLMMLSPEGLRP